MAPSSAPLQPPPAARLAGVLEPVIPALGSLAAATARASAGAAAAGDWHPQQPEGGPVDPEEGEPLLAAHDLQVFRTGAAAPGQGQGQMAQLQAAGQSASGGSGQRGGAGQAPEPPIGCRGLVVGCCGPTGRALRAGPGRRSPGPRGWRFGAGLATAFAAGLTAKGRRQIAAGGPGGGLFKDLLKSPFQGLAGRGAGVQIRRADRRSRAGGPAAGDGRTSAAAAPRLGEAGLCRSVRLGGGPGLGARCARAALERRRRWGRGQGGRGAGGGGWRAAGEWPGDRSPRVPRG